MQDAHLIPVQVYYNVYYIVFMQCQTTSGRHLMIEDLHLIPFQVDGKSVLWCVHNIRQLLSSIPVSNVEQDLPNNKPILLTPPCQSYFTA